MDGDNETNECLGYEGFFLTYIILFAAMMVVPFFILAVYCKSSASVEHGMLLGWIWLVFGACMSVIGLFDIPAQLGDPGNLIVPLAWFVPSILLALFRKSLLVKPLSQRWLVSLQLWRSIGGIFLIEMVRGNLAPIFAYAAGIGDILVAVEAAVILAIYRNSDFIPGKAIYALIVSGVLDFLSAFFFGFFSSESDAQLFFHDADYTPIDFPSGLIPLFLVPYAIFFHTLSFLSHRRFGEIVDPAITQKREMEQTGGQNEAEAELGFVEKN